MGVNKPSWGLVEPGRLGERDPALLGDANRARGSVVRVAFGRVVTQLAATRQHQVAHAVGTDVAPSQDAIDRQMSGLVAGLFDQPEDRPLIQTQLVAVLHDTALRCGSRTLPCSGIVRIGATDAFVRNKPQLCRNAGTAPPKRHPA